MALTYRNTRTGRVVTMPEPGEVLAEGEERAERASRPGTKKARREAEIIADTAARNAVHVRHTLDKMDASTKWQRYNPPSVGELTETEREADRQAAGGDPDSGPKSADVRAWAQAQGIEVPQRGRLPGEVLDAYLAAHS
ncbi:MAG: hypothetical protein GEV12_14295 [Micromonosporaceae bacterium]|nr:hypothetical protein [Micromonosporaceae bacterium]